ncbi:MAG TPA: type II toxin-antitoxin system VapC family toxin [Solirubrobacteraceae bacterium]|nr:type II toxin-antitoxin system VapC family toxin [Solirubrobacteraceae bacterium]
MHSSKRADASTSSQVLSIYIDTSALGRSLLDEPEKPAIEHTLGTFELSVSSSLLRTELRRLGFRRGMLDRVDVLLAGVSLVSVDDEILTEAETITPATVATLDAIHLATAVRLSKVHRLDALMTYDKQLADGARKHGIEVLSPS